MAIQTLPDLTPMNCAHGAPVQTPATQPRVWASGQRLLVQTDLGVATGCPFTLPNGTPSPCVQVRFLSGSTRVRASGVPVLIQTASTLCLAATQAPQGPAIIPTGSPRVMAL